MDWVDTAAGRAVQPRAPLSPFLEVASSRPAFRRQSALPGASPLLGPAGVWLPDGGPPRERELAAPQTDLVAVLREAPHGAMLQSFLLGAAYGIGGTALGISIRSIGFSLTYAIVVGLSSVLGTLIPPIVKGTLGATLDQTGAGWILADIVVGAVGIAGAGWAGRLKFAATDVCGNCAVWVESGRRLHGMGAAPP